MSEANKRLLDFVHGLKLPLDALMQPIFFGGNRGGGKTYGAKKLFEAGHAAGAQCISIAPVGKWWSLRLDKDGKSPGLKDVFIFGGTHADVPITPQSGATIAKLLVEKRIHAVIDVSLMRKGERSRFLADFLEEFWLLKKLEDASYPVVLFFEEAHAIVPQKPGPEQLRMLGAAEDLVREGRNHGVGIVLIDQRSAVVNKNVIALVEMIIVMRTIHHLDRDTYETWCTDKGDDVAWLKDVKHLQAGEAFIYCPVLNIPVTKVKTLPLQTFDATATASIGDKVAKVGVLSKVDISALKDQLGQVIEEAEKNNPAALKRQIAELQKALEAKHPKVVLAKSTFSQPVEKVIQEKVALRGDINRLDTLMQRWAKLFGQFIESSSKHLEESQQVALKLGQTMSGTKVAEKAETFTRPVSQRVPESARSKSIEKVIEKVAKQFTDDRNITGGGRRMLEALAKFESLTRAQLATLADMAESGTFDTYMARLNVLGYISKTDNGNVIQLTPGGGMEAGPIRMVSSTDEVLQLFRASSKMPGKASVLLDALVTAYPRKLTRSECAQVMGMEQSGTFDTYMARLSANDLIVKEDRGALIGANPTPLFLES